MHFLWITRHLHDWVVPWSSSQTSFTDKLHRRLPEIAVVLVQGLVMEGHALFHLRNQAQPQQVPSLAIWKRPRCISSQVLQAISFLFFLFSFYFQQRENTGDLVVNPEMTGKEEIANLSDMCRQWVSNQWLTVVRDLTPNVSGQPTSPSSYSDSKLEISSC